MGARPPSRTRPSVVFDADVLIEVLRGSAKARRFFESVSYGDRILSGVVAIELMRGSRDRPELRRVSRFIGSDFERVVHVSAEISRRAVALVERYALAHRTAISDAFIAATALTLGATLATANVRHYRYVSGLELLPFRR